MVKRNKRMPFNAKSQTPQKYHDLLNSSSSIEETASTLGGEEIMEGTSAPKGEEPISIKKKPRKGRRTKDGSLLKDLASNPLTWIVIACVAWASNTTYSLQTVNAQIGGLASQFDSFSKEASTKLEVLDRSLNQFLLFFQSSKQPAGIDSKPPSSEALKAR